METSMWGDDNEDLESDAGEDSDVPDDIEFMLYSQLHYEQVDRDETAIDTSQHNSTDHRSTRTYTKSNSTFELISIDRNTKNSTKCSSTLQKLSVDIRTPSTSVANLFNERIPSTSSTSFKSKLESVDIVPSTSKSPFGKSVSDVLFGNRVPSCKNARTDSKKLNEISNCEKGSKKRKLDSRELQKMIMIDTTSSSSDVEIVQRPKKSRKETVTVEHDSVLEPRTSFITISSDTSESSCEVVGSESSDSETEDDSDDASIDVSGVSGSESESSSSVDTTNLQVHVDTGQEDLLKTAERSEEHRERWKISEEDRLANINRHRQSTGQRFGGTGIGGRYYRPSSVKCHNCNEIGHLSKDCPKPKKSNICIMCGYTGHYYRDCPQSLCYNCNQPGHTAKECTERRQWRYQECQRCSMIGHSHKICPERWRQFHLTTEVSKKCPVKGPADTNYRRSCYNCASKKHFGYDCPRERVDRYSSPTYPLIAKYDAWHYLKTLLLPEVSSRKELKKQAYKQKKKQKKKQNKLKRQMEEEELQEEEVYSKPAKKNPKKKSKQKNWDSKFSTCPETGKQFKNAKNKRRQANKWRNKQGSSSNQRTNQGFNLSRKVKFTQQKMQH